jgi:enoyl-CoA hydratase/carnithine racemase
VTESLLSLDRRDDPPGAYVLTLRRPSQRNALSTAMLGQVRECFERIAADPGARVVVIRGEGPDFCAGADLAELSRAHQDRAGRAYVAAFDGGLDAVASCPVPVIARVQGAALGGGCQLVLACDLAVAGRGARFGIPSSRLGLVIGASNIERLVLTVGARRAGELLFAGRILDGSEAMAWGLVERVAPEDELEAATLGLAAEVAAGAPLAGRATKLGIAAVVERLRLGSEGAIRLAARFERMAAKAFASRDLEEGIRAQAERRPPRFEGA